MGVETGVHKTYVKCLLCGFEAKNLTNHLRHHHKITAKEYKQELGLCYKQSLECEETTEKRRQAVRENQHVIENLLVGGIGTRFVKGSDGNSRTCEQRREIIMNNPQTYKKRVNNFSGKRYEGD